MFYRRRVAGALTMEFGMTVDVDGSLRNPLVVATVLAWSAVLSLHSFVGAWWCANTRESVGWGSRITVLASLICLFVLTPRAQFLIGNLIYELAASGSPGPSLTSVGFFGGPSPVPAWVLAFAASLMGLRAGWRRK